MEQRDSAIAYSIDQAQRLFGKGLEVIGDRTGIESLFNYGKEIVEQQDKDIAEGNYQPEYTMGLREAYKQGGVGDAVGWVLEKSGENLATSGVAIAGGLASALTAPFSVPAAALIGGATFVSSGILGTGEVAEEMEQKTGSYNSAVAIGAGTIIGILDKFGAGRVIPKEELLSMTGKQLIQALGAEGKIDAAREIGKRIGKSVAFEGVTEGTQEGVTLGATALTGGEYTGLEVADRILEGTVLGGFMGGGTTTGIETFRQGPGIYNFTSDFLSPPPGPNLGEQLAMQTAATLSGPDYARYTMKPVPPTAGEILLNEGLNMTGGSQRITSEEIDKNLETSNEDEVNENASFFNKDLEGDSITNPVTESFVQKEENEIVEKALNKAKQEFVMTGGDGFQEVKIEDVNETTPEFQRVFYEKFANEMENTNKNMAYLENPDRPVVSPLRIKLNKLKLKYGAKKPIKLYEVYKELRSQENRRDGSVGFIGREEFVEEEVEDFRYKPKEGKGKEFGEAVKAAPKTEEGRPDYTKIPNIDDIGIKINVPKKVKRKREQFDARNTENKKVHNRGGELFTSGLEEYLVRNYKEEMTMEQIIHEFDKMRPEVAFEVRSRLNFDKATRGESTPFLTGAPSAGDMLQGNAPTQTLEGTQRVGLVFGSSTGEPTLIEQTNENGDTTGFTRNANLSNINYRDFEVDSISVVAYNPTQEKLESGSLTGSPVISSLKQHEDAQPKDLTKGASGHDYYDKGHTYARAMIVRGMDGKLHAIAEEVQSDLTRNYEALLDFAKPQYDLALKYGGLPALFTEKIDKTLGGEQPNPGLIDAKYNSTYEMMQGTSTGQTKEDFNFLTPSERQKIHVLDQIDQSMPNDKALSKFAEDLKRRKKLYDDASKEVEDMEALLKAIDEEIKQIKERKLAPQEGSKFVKENLDDLLRIRKPLLDGLLKLYKPKTITNIFSRENQQLMNSMDQYPSNQNPDIFSNELYQLFSKFIEDRKIQSDIKKKPSRFAQQQYDSNGQLNSALFRFEEAKTRKLRDKGFFNPRHHELFDMIVNHMPGKTSFGPSKNYTLMKNYSFPTEEYAEGVYKADIAYGYQDSFNESSIERSVDDKIVYETMVNKAVNEIINEQALNTLQHRLASFLASKYKNNLKDIDFHQILKNNMKPDPDDSSKTLYAESDLYGLTTKIGDIVNMSDAVNDVLNLVPEAVKIDAEKFLSRAIDAVETDIGFMPEDGGYAEFINSYFNDTTPEDRLLIIKEINKNPKKYKFTKKLDENIHSVSPHLINDKKLKKQMLMDSILKNETYNPIGGLYIFRSTQEEIAKKLLNRPLPTESHKNKNYYLGTGGYNKYPMKTNFAALFLSPAYQDFLDLEEGQRLKKHEQEERKASQRLFEAQDYIDEVGDEPPTANEEIFRRVGLLKEEIDKQADSFNYKPDELKKTLRRAENHVMDAGKRYRRTPHNASMAQNTRGMYKALLNKLTDPRFEELYGEPIHSVVIPDRLSSWKQRAESDSSLRKAGTKETFGKGTYESIPRSVMKLFEDAGARIEKNKLFEMISKDNTKTIALERPAQAIFDISPNSKGRKLAESKFTFRAKGGYIDLRRKAS